MPERKRVTVEFDQDEVELLKEALDSHEYWQLSDPVDRDSGYVMIEDNDPRIPPEIAACRALLRRLEGLGS